VNGRKQRPASPHGVAPLSGRASQNGAEGQRADTGSFNGDGHHGQRKLGTDVAVPGVARRASEIHILLIHKAHAWQAWCLDFDVRAQGPTPERAEKAMVATLRAYVEANQRERRDPLDLPRAVGECWDQYDASPPAGRPHAIRLPGAGPLSADVRVAPR
jgi:hypothetical protein